MPIVIVALVSLLFLLLIAHRLRISRIIVVAYLVRAALVFVQHNLFPLIGSNADAGVFEHNAWRFAVSGVGGWILNFSGGAYFYSWLCAIPYLVFGRNPAVLQLINVLFGTLVVYNVYRISKQLGVRDNTARAAAWVAAFFPTAVNYSAVILREALVACLLTSGVYFLLVWKKDQRILSFVRSALLLGLAATLHTGLVAVLVLVVVYLAFSAMRRAAQMEPGASIKAVLLGILTIFLLYFMHSRGLGSHAGHMSGATPLGADTSALLEEQAVVANEQARATYVTGSDVRSIGAIVVSIPKRMLYFLLAPFPWQMTTMTDMLGVVDSLLYLILLIALLRLRRAAWRGGELRLVLGIAAVTVLVFAIGTGNYGTAIRHRAKIAPLLICCAAYAFEERRGSRRDVRPGNLSSSMQRQLNAGEELGTCAGADEGRLALE
jgi:4-amino-4-deoxy-L-arabinose transferase-like glycosyltransferase